MNTVLQVRTLAELAAHVGGEVDGDPSIAIRGVNGLADAGPGDITFYGNPRYRDQLATTRASAVLVSAWLQVPVGRVQVKVAHPHLAYAQISTLFHPPARFAPGISEGAHVDPSARVHPSATVMAGATVGPGAEVGAGSVLFPGVYLGEESRVGAHCLLYANVTVRERCQLGERVTLHPGCVIGADGFGFAFDPGGEQGPSHVKIPQTGIVRIEDDVEIGACSCVDRATQGETVIGRGSKLDNLVQIAHNVKVGPLSLICAQAGVSGSAELGAGVILAGQVGVVGHIKIGNLAKVGAQSGVAHDVPEGAVMSGSPAIAHPDWLRASVAFEKIAGLVKEVRQLRRKLEALEQEKR